MPQVSDLLIPGFVACLVVPGQGEGVVIHLVLILIYKYEMNTEHFVNPNLRVVVVKCYCLGFVV